MCDVLHMSLAHRYLCSFFGSGLESFANAGSLVCLLWSNGLLIPCMFRKVFGQVITLVFPDVLFNAVLMCAFVVHTLPDCEDWDTGMMFRAKIAAFDPVLVLVDVKDTEQKRTCAFGESVFSNMTKTNSQGKNQMKDTRTTARLKKLKSMDVCLGK